MSMLYNAKGGQEKENKGFLWINYFNYYSRVFLKLEIEELFKLLFKGDRKKRIVFFWIC